MASTQCDVGLAEATYKKAKKIHIIIIIIIIIIGFDVFVLALDEKKKNK
jgi:hypothetical protein